ncbi:ABC transporter substrate-binding protein [Leifsonia aquatica]|uniref:ABC transporter substrate-binding protein n=1 Tax=Leifsonia aquatica TaxID=144185 RepID=UPI000468343B|nr:sugar ABC transporter substrate-binding protein [Leifsonia aquatica]
MKLKKIVPIAAGAAVLMALAGCTGGGGSDGKVTVNWWTWDPNPAAAYQQCIPAFEKENPDITVKISQYQVSDYFTKITAGFVSGDAPDAFMNSVTYLQSYASQHQLLAMDDKIKQDTIDMSQYAIGTDAWKYTDGKQYALPMDWATGVLYFNTDLLEKAGYTVDDMAKATWNPDDGGTLWQMIKHLTVDKNGVRGDQPGFDSKNIATYGMSNLESTGDPFGQNAWGWILPNDGINIPNKNQWATVFNYNDPKVVSGIKLVRTLANDGYTPQLNQFTTASNEQLASGNVAITLGGTWEASTYAALKTTTVGIAPMPAGSDGKRHAMSNSNGNNIWAGGKHIDQTWKWVAYQESEACQTKAATYNASFFPSIGASMDALSQQESAKLPDFRVFSDYVKNDELFPSPIYNNGAALTNAMVPQFESYFTNKADESIFQKMQEQSKELLAKK